MTIFVILFITTCFLAYANGANDNFKGVATLFGSGTTNYKHAIGWATITTFAGSVCSIFLAEKLLKNFSGKGLVPVEITTSPEFLAAVALGAGLTVLFTALRGLPISTTHSLVGGLVGSGIMAVGSQVNFNFIGKTFFIPLLVSPFIAVCLAYILYRVFRGIRNHFGINKEWCACIGESNTFVPVRSLAPEQAANFSQMINASVDTKQNCQEHYTGHFFGINLQKLLDIGHFISAGMVSFARGLNDTPKIVALLIAIQGLSIKLGMIAVAIGIAIGGLLNAKRIAETMGKKITPMSHGQGFAANLVTGFMVIVASRFGVPVSTTHCSVGSLFGIGLITGKADKSIVSQILISWLLTLPVAASLSAIAYYLLNLL
ncbi:MAG: inorganic phosphate transporter [Gammaproteobacteria bacterium]|jgi:PiT family inorganic phosphate transporter